MVFDMAKVYAEFGIEVFDNSIKNNCIKVMEKLGSININETKQKTILINFTTSTKSVIELETLSDLLCSIIEPQSNEIKEMLIQYHNKLYSDICFVKISDENDIEIKLNKRIIELAYLLNIEISFDGF